MMENKLRFPLDLQLFAEKGKSGNDIDPDKALEEMDDAKNVDDETDDDLEEDEEDIDEEDIEDEDEDLDEDEDSETEDDEDSDEDEDSEDEDDKEDEKSDKDADSKDDKSKEDDKSSDTKKQPQNRDVNKEQKALRLQREAEERARKENFQKGFIAALGGINPYTNEKIETEEDIHEAQVMIEAKKRGLDPIQDYSKVDKALRLEEKQKAAEEAQKKVDAEKARADDFKEFSEEYPDVDVAKLFDDKDFEEFASDLVGNVPLKTIYAKYQKIQEKQQNAVEDSKDMAKARRQSSPGSAGSGGDKNSQFYTMDELKKMSQEEVEKNWAKVERSYDHINKHGKK